ncbi:unnamed protein product [Trifolium pratense]|uniref:Uncharacterized protein n=1 Tax=Trifolium pratense TaxID=57577 RepID=A0ACB0K2H9_TRIPR|nr:unnamed protein product [Trifolium pratense]
MNVLQNSPHAQALAFNNISLDFFNNFWAWLAVIFWRIRTPKPELLKEVLEPCHDDDDDDDDNGGRPTTCVHSVSEDVVGITKGKMKFTSYYYEDDHHDHDDIGNECKKIDETLPEELLGWWERWEKLLRTRTGENENGWYKCQDLTVFNGNVVRFWDDADGGSCN